MAEAKTEKAESIFGKAERLDTLIITLKTSFPDFIWLASKAVGGLTELEDEDSGSFRIKVKTGIAATQLNRAEGQLHDIQEAIRRYFAGEKQDWE